MRSLSQRLPLKQNLALFQTRISEYVYANDLIANDALIIRISSSMSRKKHQLYGPLKVCKQ